MKYFICYMLLINLIGFLVTAADKALAKKDKRRVPEKTLFILAVMGGSIGVFGAMLAVRHKTKHMSFVLGIPAIIIAQTALIWLLAVKVF